MHFLVLNLNKVAKEHQISVIPRNTEKYLSLQVGNFIFIDSFQFLPTSLETLVSNLVDKGQNSFRLTAKYIQNDVQRKLLLRKGVFCYDFLDSMNKFTLAKLPPASCFYNTLTEQHISPADYKHALEIWNAFHCKNLGDYHDVYLRSHLLLLADVFENYRQMNLECFNLDPAQYLSGPQISFDACLKMTKIKLELISDLDMYNFFEKGIRGGVSTISQRFTKANNVYNPDYDPSEPNSYIIDIDANSLYSWAMEQKLPTGEFRWLTVDEIQELNVETITDHSPVGYVLEVDLKYPIHLHTDTAHVDYPLAPEKISITRDQLSPTARILCRDQASYASTKAFKLIPNFYDKRAYILHYRNLKLYLKLGLELVKIRRVVSFKQSAWIKPYIEFIAKKRKEATNQFENSNYKRYLNSVFGKFLQGTKNRCNVRLVSEKSTFEHLASKQTYRSSKIFNKNLVGVQMKKPIAFLNRPIYEGMCILDISKCKMYEMHHMYIKQKYGSAARLLFTDTDSLTYHIITNDVYADLAIDEHIFDFSNYPVAHYMYNEDNKCRPGFFKDKLAGKLILECCGLKSKLYSIYTYMCRKTNKNS